MSTMNAVKYYKIFLIGSNIGLLFVGLTIFILGIKMQWALSVLLLINIPIVMKAVEAVIATGFFISFSGVTGLCGACSENKWLLLGYLLSLGIIVVMEFSLGVTLMIVKKTVSAALLTPDCNNVCSASIDAIILEYALPSAGLMMTIIFVEALMIYSSIKMYFYIRDGPKATDTGPPSISQDVQMRNVGRSLSPYATTPLPMHSSPYEYSPQSFQRSYIYQTAGQTNLDSAVEDNPPDYDSLLLPPPCYHDRTTSTYVESGLESTVESVEDTESKQRDESFRDV